MPTVRSIAKPYFWSQPFRYLRWSAHEKPALFYSVVIGLIGPVMIAVVPPIRYRMGDNKRPPIPLTYPIPAGPRKIPQGFDD